ncbi:Dihydropteroate synthase [uncultured Candidatus Thioglobus sp.]|nr:Dihydropteroate synthase [uncultured Candidatus Thioglobus sp.]
MANKTQIMGILNVTPDSFSDGGKHFSATNAIQSAQRMIEQGADIIDVGGESTRPNAKPVSTTDELNRVIPVINSIAKIPNIRISIDTSKPEVMQKAVQAGAEIINDVYALRAEGALEMAVKLEVDVCLMHMQGEPRTMQNNPVYKDVIDDIKHFFEARIEACVRAGMNENKIILDPGFGFGKTYKHNLTILNRFDAFKSFGLPLLAGLSRKRMIGEMLGGKAVNDRMTGSVTGAIIAAQNGADIVRVHDVLETKEALSVLQCVTEGRNE